jgi:HlyD family secretion protein
LTNLLTAEEKYNTAKGSLAVSERNLAVTKSGATEEQIKSQEARVLQYKAEEQKASSELNKLSLRSPINGVVTKQEAKLGETLTSGTLAVSVISDGSYQIEANVSEVSVGKVSIGNRVYITMDAFADKNFPGTVSYIEPAETLIDGVVNYKTIIDIDKDYFSYLKSGLTANLMIETYKKENVLVIPNYAVSKKDDKYFVNILVSKKVVEKEIGIDTGLISNDGLVEVLWGLSEGDVVVINK